MNYDMIEPYIERVYGYAVNRTHSREDADELAQEILLTVIRELPNLRDESKFEPWLWGIANNLTRNFWRKSRRQNEIYSYEMLSTLSYEDTYFDEQEELYDALRKKILMLSAIYREILILYYYDGLSTKAIAEKLDIPEGTVQWRLFKARQKIKQEGLEVNEKMKRPIKLKLQMYGFGDYNGKNIPFPPQYIDDALSQNILYHCYEEPKTVEDLAKVCNVPAYYIEDRIENLLNREAIIEMSKGKFLTDFIIFSDKHSDYCEANAERMLMPLIDRLLDALNDIAKEAADIGFYKAGKSEADLFYLYGAMAFAFMREHYCDLPNPPLKWSYDGNRWRYFAKLIPERRRIQLSINSQYDRDGGVCGYVIFFSLNGTKFRPFPKRKILDVCEDLLLDGATKDVEAAAEAIKDGYIIKQPDGSLAVSIPFFTKEQKDVFHAIAERHLVPLMPEYSKIVKQFAAGYKRLIPAHLQDDADRFCQRLFLGFYTVIVEYAQKTGVIPMPSSSQYCDVLLQFKERNITDSGRE